MRVPAAVSSTKHDCPSQLSLPTTGSPAARARTASADAAATTSTVATSAQDCGRRKVTMIATISRLRLLGGGHHRQRHAAERERGAQAEARGERLAEEHRACGD